MDLRPQAPEIPSAADEVPIDDLLAGVRTTAELNELIREGLAAARRGGQDFPGVHPRRAGPAPSHLLVWGLPRHDTLGPGPDSGPHDVTSDARHNLSGLGAHCPPGAAHSLVFPRGVSPRSPSA
jgi:hypothetical protein